jgi:ribosome maturation factor RimP
LRLENMTTDKTRQTVLNLITPIIESMGFELVDLRIVGSGSGQTFQILADKEGGITLDECGAISRELGPHLEVEDAILGEYALEVSSPGIRRPLTNPQHFERFKDQLVLIKTHSLIDGRKRFKGVNLGLNEAGAILLELDDGTTITIDWDDIATAKLDPVIDI